MRKVTEKDRLELDAEIAWATEEVDKLKAANKKIPRILADMLWLLENAREDLNVNQSERTVPAMQPGSHADGYCG